MVQVVPGGNDTTLRTRIACSLGASFTWAAADRAHIVIPVTASSAAQGNLTNEATATDNQNRTASDRQITLVEAAPLVSRVQTRLKPTTLALHIVSD